MESYEYYLETYGIGYWPMLNDLTIRIDEEMVRFSKWNDDSYLHRLDGPALIYLTSLIILFLCPMLLVLLKMKLRGAELKLWL